MVSEQVRRPGLSTVDASTDQLRRRAKMKNIAKRSLESGEDCNDIPESMRRYLALQAMESGKTLGRDLLSRHGGMAAYGSGMLFNSESSQTKVGMY